MLMMCVSGVHSTMIRMTIATTALVCVGMVVAVGTLCVVTAVFMSFALRMTSAVQTTVFIAGLACRLYGGRWEHAVHKVMTANVTLLYNVPSVVCVSSNIACMHCALLLSIAMSIHVLSRLQCKFIVCS